MDVRDSQLRTPLMTAMHAGNADVVSVFLKPKGSAASCLDRDREGRAAVHWTLHNSVRQYQCCSASREKKKENALKARSYRDHCNQIFSSCQFFYLCWWKVRALDWRKCLVSRKNTRSLLDLHLFKKKRFHKQESHQSNHKMAKWV